MTKVIDVRTSQNASENNISIPVTRDTETLFAQVGLNAAGAEGVLRVTMSGIIALDIKKPGTKVTVSVVRGTLSTDQLVLRTVTTVNDKVSSPFLLTFSGADFNVPFEPEIVYSVFVLVNKKGVTRTGPESFFAHLHSD